MRGPLPEDDREARPAASQPLKLRLYITNQSPNSARALANVQTICQDLFGAGQYELEVVDILIDPLRAVNDRIIVTPTLVRLPLPSMQIVGDLSERDKVMVVLKLLSNAR